MEVERPRPVNPAMTFDEASMERSKSFVKALQELKNLRPQLYSAAEYCEKSYLRSEQKQMVLDNLKDYAVRALVNAVDHLGTVAYKLTDLLDQQTLDVSTMELKVTSTSYMPNVYGKEGIRQQQLLAIIPRHHKHYVLPNSVNKKVHFSPLVQTDARQHYFQARSRLQPSSSPASKSLSWHLASETTSTMKGTSHSPTSTEDTKVPGKTSDVFHLLDNEENIPTKSSAAHLQQSGGVPGSTAIMQTLLLHDLVERSKPLTAFRSFDNQNRREIVHVPVRSRSMLSAFFVKQKTRKMRAGPVS
ncbi:hypothetical protein FNV43_RR01191 [Rhamnella rubrinervis]|uniref:Protein ABIL1 n=1 Tax=Rhamnella rubrinervis TaxID=2594499 RepID=A0A8K0HS14_9ROSA|nr:hypothetical protein FNV43_RR01191 [Rhamnella rubrinervis]